MIALFPRKVLAPSISRSTGTRLVTITFRVAYAERRAPKKLTFHSDRGGQYIVEAFFTTFKKEEVYRRKYPSERHFRQSVDEYIRFYNEIRPHATLKYKTPQAFEAAYIHNYIEKPCSNNEGE